MGVALAPITYCCLSYLRIFCFAVLIPGMFVHYPFCQCSFSKSPPHGLPSTAQLNNSLLFSSTPMPVPLHPPFEILFQEVSLVPTLGQALPLGFPPSGPDYSACASLSLPLSQSGEYFIYFSGLGTVEAELVFIRKSIPSFGEAHTEWGMCLGSHHPPPQLMLPVTSLVTLPCGCSYLETRDAGTSLTWSVLHYQVPTRRLENVEFRKK